MIKTILKETTITILLSAIIVLLLGILFYEYIPNNKIIPNKVAYTMNEINAKANTNMNTNTNVNTEILVTYTIEESDLSVYQKAKEYVPGKVNPFAAYVEENKSENANVPPDQINNDTNSSQTPENNSNSTDGRLFENKTGK